MFKNTPFILFILVFGISILLSCENENILVPASEKIPTVSCNDTTYSCLIKPIFDANCIVCHNTSQHQLNVILDTYDEAKKIAMDGTRLSDAINHRTVKMPFGRTQLPDSTIKKLDKWISKGAPK